ncbi:MAG: MFS transporter [Candidatus Marinimicrobia bacterium]|nr:MFS transporter [Candidatus Neomarinimicrobiota bacterium]
MTTAGNNNNRVVFAWSMYDFANSAFTTLVVTFIYSTYFVKAIAPDVITGTVLWSRAVTITGLTVALLSPILGALADRGGHRKLYLALATAICVVATTGLYTVLPGAVMQALAWFVIANIAFELGGVFYNAFLPEIAPAGRIGRTSGFGWSLGYVGGLGCMALAMVGFVNPDVPWFGLTKELGQNIRATNLLVALWFAVFSLPIFLWVREDKNRISPPGAALVRDAWRQLADTFKELRRYRQLLRFLVARLVYNDALVTIFAFGGIYAAGTFDFSFEKIMIFGIVLNVAAGMGAFFMGYMDDRLGGKKTILVATAGLVLATVIAALTTSEAVFWGAGILIGLMAGPNQAASRSLMTRFTPPEMKSQFFGFYAFSGKATAFVGPLALGVLTQQFNSQRAGIWVVALLFVVGGLLLWAVDEKQGIAAVQGPQQKQV